MSDHELLCGSPLHTVPTLDFDRLMVVSALGRGAKGVVFLVREEEEEEESAGELLALKVILRDSIEKKKHHDGKDGNEYKRVIFEQQVLKRFDHALLPRLRGVLATEKVVGYAIDYCPGRDLNFLRKKQTEKMFSDDIIRFYAAELVLAMEYLHNQGIVYRDLKPENIMIQENGHIMLVDFDLSTKLSPRSAQSSPSPISIQKSESVRKKRFSLFQRWCNSGILPDDSAPHPESSSETETDSSEKSNSFVGTEEYVAPEIISGDGHDFEVDWWSLGVVLYEMLYGRTPFKGPTRKETFYRILMKTPDLVGEKTALRDLIGKLLEKNPKQRITVEGIKSHSFFSGVDWEMVLQLSRTPYIPCQEGLNGSEKEGIKRDDVEMFVEKIFGSEDGKVEGVDDNGNWVKGVNNESFEVSNFLVF